MATTLGKFLIKDLLPEHVHAQGPLTKKTLTNYLVTAAKEHPEQYSENTTKLKRIGDMVATLEGISVGVDDIEPDYKTRDPILEHAYKQFHAEKDENKKRSILIETQNKLLDYSKTHPGTMSEMARSGGRGNAAQLMKTIGSPVVAMGEKESLTPWLIKRSYAEGLKPSDGWAAGNEARILEIQTRTSVSEPGDLGKILINNMADKLITIPDCHTKNGIAINTDDPHLIDRYLAQQVDTVPAGTLITPQIAAELHKKHQSVVARSPMTCEAPHGICQKCQGLNQAGKLHAIGTNIGLRAAQAMAEPLTQISLGAKHAKDLAATREKTVSGIKGIKQLLEIPKSFLHQAAVANSEGKVTKIEKAPQGGHYVWIDKDRHYIHPELALTVKPNDHVEAGDALSDGIPKPDLVVQHKGLGTGRKYIVDSLHKSYANNGIDIDKRYFETLARSMLNYVHVDEVPDHHDHGLLKGDVVNYNQLQKALASSNSIKPLTAASIGESLGGGILHYTAGTKITKTILEDLKKHGITEVPIALDPPKITPIMKAASRTPLLNPDWMARLAHRYLKDSLLSGAHRADVSDLHGHNPIPAYAQGFEFGSGPEGRY